MAKLVGGALVFFIVVGFIITAMSFVRVEGGYGCVYRQHGEARETLDAGMDWKNPIGRSTRCYSIRSLVYEAVNHDNSESKADYVDHAIQGVTRDGQPVTITFTVRYSLPIENLMTIHNTIGPDIDKVNERVVKFHSRTVIPRVINTHSANELYLGGLESVSREISEILAPRFDESGVKLEYFEIKRPGFSDEYMKAVEAKQLKKEEAEAAKNQQEVAKAEAETKKINAQANADVQLIEAEGKAKALATEGQVYRDYPELMEVRSIEALANANLIVVPADSMPIIDLSDQPVTPEPEG